MQIKKQMHTLKQIIENYHEIVILAFRHVSGQGACDLITMWLFVSWVLGTNTFCFIVMAGFLLSIFYITLSPHFIPGLQSAVCVLHWLSWNKKIKLTLLQSGLGLLVGICIMSSRNMKIKRRLLKNGLRLLAKEYKKNPSYGHTQ